jgi:hypothetical protein
MIPTTLAVVTQGTSCRCPHRRLTDCPFAAEQNPRDSHSGVPTRPLRNASARVGVVEPGRSPDAPFRSRAAYMVETVASAGGSGGDLRASQRRGSERRAGAARPAAAASRCDVHGALDRPGATVSTRTWELGSSPRRYRVPTSYRGGGDSRTDYHQPIEANAHKVSVEPPSFTEEELCAVTS